MPTAVSCHPCFVHSSDPSLKPKLLEPSIVDERYQRCVIGKSGRAVASQVRVGVPPLGSLLPSCLLEARVSEHIHGILPSFILLLSISARYQGTK